MVVKGTITRDFWPFAYTHSPVPGSRLLSNGGIWIALPNGGPALENADVHAHRMRREVKPEVR